MRLSCPPSDTTKDTARVGGGDHGFVRRGRWRPTLDSAGFGGSDVVLNAFAYHPSPAGAMFEEARRQPGATVLPGGGQHRRPGDGRCAALGVTAYVGLPASTTKTPSSN